MEVRVRTGLFVAGVVLTAVTAESAAAKPPDVSKLLAPEDVRAALGTGFALVPGSAATTSEISSCLYRRGSDSATVAIMGSPGDNAVEALKAQAQGQFKAQDRTAKALPELGEGAFCIVLKSGTKMGLFAPKGHWRITVEVYAGPQRKPDLDAATRLAKIIQTKLP
jgi:hypothetical protein